MPKPMPKPKPEPMPKPKPEPKPEPMPKPDSKPSLKPTTLTSKRACARGKDDDGSACRGEVELFVRVLEHVERQVDPLE
eukprot:5522739-Pleurochrysis_carterae.AAC.1